MTDEENLTKINESLAGINLSDPKTAESFKNAIKGSNSEDLNKIYEEIKTLNTNLKPVERTKSEKDYYHFLTDKEKTSEDKSEKKRLGFNRFINSILLGATSPYRENLANYYKHVVDPNSEGSTTGGGYTVPTFYYPLIADDLRTSGLALSKTRVMTVGTNLIKLPTLTTYAPATPYLPINVPVPAGTAEYGKKPALVYTFGITTFTINKYSFIVPFTTELLEDSNTDLEGFLRANMVDYYSILMDNILWRGDSSLSHTITGLNGNTNVQTKAITGLTISTMTWADLVGVPAKLRATDLKDAEWYMTPSVWYAIHALKDKNDRPFLTEMDIKNFSLLGFPVNLTDSCYTVSEAEANGANTPFITFGNLNKSVWLAIRNQMTALRSQEASYYDGTNLRSAFAENEVLLRTEMRFDIETPFPKILVNLTLSAS